MPKITCTCFDCKYCDDDCQCTAEEIKLTNGNIATVWEGRRDVWWCRSFEMSEEAKAIHEKVKEYFEGARKSGKNI